METERPVKNRSLHSCSSAGQKNCLHNDTLLEIEFETRESRSAEILGETLFKTLSDMNDETLGEMLHDTLAKVGDQSNC